MNPEVIEQLNILLEALSHTADPDSMAAIITLLTLHEDEELRNHISPDENVDINPLEAACMWAENQGDYFDLSARILMGMGCTGREYTLETIELVTNDVADEVETPRP